MNLLVKTIGLVAAATLATANFADEAAQPLQLAQLTDGFNAESTYMASCFACHSTGAAGAPKVGAGNAEVWETRLEKGLDAVVGNAINGVGVMPAKGLCFTCTDEDLGAIVEYMVASSK
jgi:cytochrome c5